MQLDVRQVQNFRELDACYLVRMAVFVDEQKVPPWEEMDAFDESADHFAVFRDSEIVGTARIVDIGDNTGKIGRVAILKESRNIGLGRALMLHVVVLGFEKYESLILDAQLPVIPFYERLGFAVVGDVFLDAGIEHKRMVSRRIDYS